MIQPKAEPDKGKPQMSVRWRLGMMASPSWALARPSWNREPRVEAEDSLCSTALQVYVYSGLRGGRRRSIGPTRTDGRRPFQMLSSPTPTPTPTPTLLASPPPPPPPPACQLVVHQSTFLFQRRNYTRSTV
jgi:hypothetical protein